MSSLSDCCNPCNSTVLPTQIPGVQGDPGAAGQDGTNGVNAFTTLSAETDPIPAIGDTFMVSVGNSTWMVVGQNIFIEGPANFKVDSIPGPSTVVLEFLGYTGDVAVGTQLPAGAGVSPGGLEGPSSIDDPLLIANGGTSAATKAGAQVALGLGQTIVKSDSDALAYDITNSYGSVGLSIVATAAGLWLIHARVTVVYTGVTFASSRTLSLRVRNTTAGTTLAETTRPTGVHTTTTFPAIDYVLDFEAATLALNDTLQIQVQLDTVESAGSSVISSASLAIVPLALS